jgi:hypothetical protein
MIHQIRVERSPTQTVWNKAIKEAGFITNIRAERKGRYKIAGLLTGTRLYFRSPAFDHRGVPLDGDDTVAVYRDPRQKKSLRRFWRCLYSLDKFLGLFVPITKRWKRWRS